MFFETIMDAIISHQPGSQLQPEAAIPRENFGFKVDTFNLYNSLQEMKKVPITKIYPQMIKPIKTLSADFSGIQSGLASEEDHGSSYHIIDALGDELLEFVQPYSTSQDHSMSRFNQFLQPFFYVNPDRIEFSGKMCLYTQKVLERHLYESKSHFEANDTLSLKCCLIYKFLSFIFFAKKIQWAHKITEVILDHHLQSLRSRDKILILTNPKDQVHLLTSIFSGLFKMDQTDRV